MRRTRRWVFPQKAKILTGSEARDAEATCFLYEVRPRVAGREGVPSDAVSPRSSVVTGQGWAADSGAHSPAPAMAFSSRFCTTQVLTIKSCKPCFRAVQPTITYPT